MNNGLVGYPKRNALASVAAVSTNATRVGYTSSGTWTVPAGITRAVLHLNTPGAGGGGGDASSCGSGGNGGNYLAVAVDVTPGEVLTYTIGAAGTGGAAGGQPGVKGGDIIVTRSNGTILAWACGGLSGAMTSYYQRPPPNPDIYIANGTLIAFKKGGRGGRGHSAAASYGGGGGGGAGWGMGWGIEATDGTPAVDVNTAAYGVGGLGSTGPLGAHSVSTAGVSPPITLSPESGSGADYNGGAGANGGRGAGGSGGTGNTAGGAGGAGYFLIEY